MRDALAGKKAIDFTGRRTPTLVFGKQVAIPDVTCQSVGSARQRLQGSRVPGQRRAAPGRLAAARPAGGQGPTRPAAPARAAWSSIQSAAARGRGDARRQAGGRARAAATEPP